MTDEQHTGWRAYAHAEEFEDGYRAVVYFECQAARRFVGVWRGQYAYGSRREAELAAAARVSDLGQNPSDHDVDVQEVFDLAVMPWVNYTYDWMKVVGMKGDYYITGAAEDARALGSLWRTDFYAEGASNESAFARLLRKARNLLSGKTDDEGDADG